MAEGEITPSNVPAKTGSFFKKDLGGIPLWGWALIVVGGVLIAVYISKNGNPLSALTSGGSTGTAATTLAGQSGNGTVPVTYNGTANSGATTGNGFATTSVNGQTVPILPSGWKALYDNNGNVVGYQQNSATTDNSNSTGNTVSTTAGSATSGLPDGTFTGPTGVLHYRANGSETLSQIASKYNLSSWNSIYAIPDNQKLFGALDAKAAANYKPASGQVITLPPLSGGGNDRTYQSNIFGAY